MCLMSSLKRHSICKIAKRFWVLSLQNIGQLEYSRCRLLFWITWMMCDFFSNVLCMLSGHSFEPQTQRYHVSGLSSVTTALYDACRVYTWQMCVPASLLICAYVYVCVREFVYDYMSDSKLSAMLVCPSGTDPLVSGLCKALWSSWLLTRLSTARYRYWYCSCKIPNTWLKLHLLY